MSMQNKYAEGKKKEKLNKNDNQDGDIHQSM